MAVAKTEALRIGAIEATVLDDGPITAPAGFLFSNAEPDELTPMLARAGATPDAVPAGLAGMLLRMPSGANVLLDPGTGGRWHEGLGAIPISLEQVGVSPADIDCVVISHGHPDHLGGLLDAAGRLRYHRARHVMSREEWDHWTSRETLQSVDPTWASIAGEVLPQLEGTIELTEGVVEIVEGVWTLPSPGHTPGHIGARVESEGQVLLWWGDAFGHPLGVGRPDWMVATDGDPVRTEATRNMLIALAEQLDATVFVNHFAFPGVGTLRRGPEGTRWEPMVFAESTSDLVDVA